LRSSHRSKDPVAKFREKALRKKGKGDDEKREGGRKVRGEKAGKLYQRDQEE